MNTQYCFMYTMSSESEVGESVYFPMTVHALPQFCAIMNILSVSVLLIMPLIAVGMKLHNLLLTLDNRIVKGVSQTEVLVYVFQQQTRILLPELLQYRLSKVDSKSCVFAGQI